MKPDLDALVRGVPSFAGLSLANAGKVPAATALDFIEAFDRATGDLEKAFVALDRARARSMQQRRAAELRAARDRHRAAAYVLFVALTGREPNLLELDQATRYP